MPMSVFTFPLASGDDKEKLLALIHDLAERTQATTVVTDQICVRTNNTKLALILRQLACEDPDTALDVSGEMPVVRRRARRKENGNGGKGHIANRLVDITG